MKNGKGLVQFTFEELVSLACELEAKKKLWHEEKADKFPALFKRYNHWKNLSLKVDKALSEFNLNDEGKYTLEKGKMVKA